MIINLKMDAMWPSDSFCISHLMNSKSS